MKNALIKVGIFMGSDSDEGIMEKAKKVLEDFGVPFGAKVISAHRTPEEVKPTVEKAISRIQ